MRNFFSCITALAAMAAISTGCGKKGSKGLADNGQLMGQATSARQNPRKPMGMVYIPPGTFHMGP
ncbi:MAG: gliding motility-associated lipoprotein, partial [Sphingobacteriaceae bacterium]